MKQTKRFYGNKLAKLIEMYQKDGAQGTARKLGISRWHVTCWATMMRRIGINVGKPGGRARFYTKERLAHYQKIWNEAANKKVFAKTLNIPLKRVHLIQAAMRRYGLEIRNALSVWNTYQETWNSSKTISEFAKKAGISNMAAHRYKYWATRNGIKLRKFPDERTSWRRG